MPANIGAIAAYSGTKALRLHYRDRRFWLRRYSLMNGMENKLGGPRSAVRFELLVLIVLVCSWHGAAVGGARNTDQRPSPRVDLLTTSLNQYRQFGAPVQERDRRGKFVPAIWYARLGGDLQVPHARHRVARPADPLIPVTLIVTKPSPGFGFGERDAAEVAALIRKKEFDKALALATRMTQSSPNDPSGYNLQGTAYLGKRDRANARKSFQKALKVHPDDAIALENLAQIDIQQKDTAAARKRFQSVLAKDGNDVPAMLGMAQLEFLKGDDKAALGWFEKAKVARPQAVDPRLNIAAYHMRRGNFTQAIDELTEAARVIPGNAEILNLLGQAQLADGQSESATATFKRLVAARPDAPLAYYRLATAQIGTKDPSGAAQSLTKALQLKPEFVDAAVLLAGLEARANRYPEALKLAKQVQSVKPGSSTGVVLEGDILLAQERYADAAKAYEKAFSISPAGAVVVKLHAARTRSGNAKEADAALQGWLRDHPDDLLSLHYSAAESAAKGQNKLAMEQYRRVLQKDPKNQLALNNLAGLYQREGDPRALETAEAAYKLNPESPTIADTLGWILVEQGKTTRGLQLLQSAFAREPKNPEIRYHLAAARAKSGDKVNARKELEALLANGEAFPQRDAAQALLKQL